MAQTIKLKRSATAGAIPGTSDLELGEIALNTRDGAVYIKKNDGSSDSIVAVHDNDILHIDTSNSRIGIGTTSPIANLDVIRGAATGLSSVNARTTALFQNNNSSGTVISVNAPNTGYSGIFLGDPQNEAQGQIKQVHTDNTMQFCTMGGATEMTLKNGKLGIGTTDPASSLHVSTSGAPTFRLSRTGTGQVWVQTIDSSARLHIQEAASEGGTLNTRLKIDDTGEITFNEAYTFPTSDGSANQILKTDGSGALTFADESGGGASGQIETNTMTGDGTDTTLTLTSAPSSEDHLIVFVDGVYQNKDSYSISSTTLTFGTAPDNGTAVVAHHIKGGIVGTAPSIDTMTGDNSDTTLTLSTAPVSENATFVTIDGVVQHKSTYSVSGTTLTFSTAPPTGSAVECITFVNTTTASTVLKDDDNDTQIQVEESSDEDKIRFDTAGTERMIITNAGNVGIGTSSPAEKLHVVGDARIDTDLYIQPTNKFYLDGGNDTYISEAAANTMVFNTAGAERMRIKSNGFVGIGTTSPLDLLHIKSSSTDARLVMDGHTDADAEVKFAEAGSVKFTIGNDAATDSFVIGTTNVDTNKRFEINSSGVIKFNGAYTFPTSDGSANQVLQTDGSGALSFGTISTSDSTKLPLAGGTMTGNLTLNGADIVKSGSADLTIDVGGRINLSADDNGEVRLYDGSSLYGQFKDDDDRLSIQGLIQDKDMLFVVNDGGSMTTALKLDAADGGDATFYGGVTINGDSSINRGNQTSGELLLGGITDGGFVDFDGTALQLNTQRDPNTGTFINTSKSNARIELIGADGDAHIKFRTTASNNTSATERMRISKTGNVGINNTSPTSLLHLGSNSTSSAIDIGFQNSSRHYTVKTESGNFILKDESAAANRIQVNTSGRVQIGTATTFNAGLHVSNGDVRATGAAFANDANSISMSWESSGIGYLTARGPSTSERGKLGLSVNRSNGAAGITGLLIDNDGAVLINTTVNAESQAMRIRQGGSNANAALSLDSDTGDQSYYRYMRFYRKGQTSSIAKLDIDFSASTIGLAYTSDERYKDITGDADGLNLITKLKPIKYKWKEGSDLGDGTETQGFGAQSYKQAFDEVGSHPRGVSVPEDEDTEKWTLDYTHLVPNLVKAIQELEAEVTTLRARITAEENR